MFAIANNYHHYLAPAMIRFIISAQLLIISKHINSIMLRSPSRRLGERYLLLSLLPFLARLQNPRTVECLFCVRKVSFFAFCSFLLLCFLSSEFTRFFRKIKGKRLRFRFEKEASGGESSRIGTGLSTEEAVAAVSDFVFESFRWKEKSRERASGKLAEREDRVESWYRERHGQLTDYIRYRI